MLSSFVIRLAPTELATGRLTGDVEHVATGVRGAFADAQELTAWCATMAAAAGLMTLPSGSFGLPQDHPR